MIYRSNGYLGSKLSLAGSVVNLSPVARYRVAESVTGVTLPLRADTWRCCGGRGSTGAHGMRWSVCLRQLIMGTWNWHAGRFLTYLEASSVRLLGLSSWAWLSFGEPDARSKIYTLIALPFDTTRLNAQHAPNQLRQKRATKISMRA